MLNATVAQVRQQAVQQKLQAWRQRDQARNVQEPAEQRHCQMIIDDAELKILKVITTPVTSRQQVYQPNGVMDTLQGLFEVRRQELRKLGELCVPA